MTGSLFATDDLGIGSDLWRPARDGDPIGLALYQRHYSARHYDDGRRPALFVGPGEKLVLISHDDKALFVWRQFIDQSGQQGVNCAVFRNEGIQLSSTLIADAERFAWARWAGLRLYTYVDPEAVRSTNPGCCFKKAGWTICGTTKGGHGRRPLLILERLPDPEPVVDMFASGYRLTPWQMEILEFERTPWRSQGRRVNAILERFGHDLTRHTQVVLHLITLPAAVAYDPQLVKRLTRLANARRAQRLGVSR